MIVAVGLDVDSTFASFVDRALNAGVALTVVNLRAVVDAQWMFEFPIRSAAMVKFKESTVTIKPTDNVFCRIIDLSGSSVDPTTAKRWQAMIHGFYRWLDAIPGRVINRWRAVAHNGSKPLHEAQLRKMGFNVPETLTSSSVDSLHQFMGAGVTVSKALCGIRAHAAIVTSKDLEGFEAGNGPVHLQRFIKGEDARIHVIGSSIVAQKVLCEDEDYRRAGLMHQMKAFEISHSMRDCLVRATRNLGLEFAGWDFKIDQNGNFWCLEVNPMPGYAPYDDQCEGLISDALLGHLNSGVPVS